MKSPCGGIALQASAVAFEAQLLRRGNGVVPGLPPEAAMDELGPIDVTWYPEDRTELRDWLMPEIEAVAQRYRRYTGTGAKHIEITIVDERGDTKQMHFPPRQRLAD